MNDIPKKVFDFGELKWGAIKRFDGANEKTAQLTFCSYIVFFKDEKGLFRNAVAQNEIYDDLEGFVPMSHDKIKYMRVGKKYIDIISDNAAFILYRAFDVNKKKKYSIEDVEQAILACDMLYFKDRELIESKINNGFQKVKKM